MPNPTVASASITPSGEWLWVPLLRSDGVTSALGGIQAIAATGATITIDGVTTPLTLGVCNNMLEGLLYPLGTTRISRVLDDDDAGWTSTGTWTAVTPTASVGGYFSASGARNAKFRTSTTGTCTWTFTGLTPGRYRLSVHLWDLVGPGRTIDAAYTARDGGGATLGTFSFDLTATLHPSFDRARYNLALHDLGFVTLPAGQTAIAVTLANGAGTGLLVADALVLESAFLPPVTPGMVVTASFPAGTATVLGQPTDAATDVPVTFEDDESFCHPIHPPGERTLRVGYGVTGVRQDWASVYLADRSLACVTWRGDVTVDEHYEMVTNTGTAERELFTITTFSGDRGLSPWGLYLLDEGVQRFEFTVSGATFDATARSNVNLVPLGDGQALVGAKTWTDLGAGRWRMEVPVSRPVWEPITTRSRDFNPYWSQGLVWQAVTPGVVYKDWHFYDSRVPIGYTGVAHPDFVAHYQGKNLILRAMDWLGTNFSPQAQPGDYTTPADRATPVSPGSDHGFRIFEANVVAIHPVDFDPVLDPDHFHRWFTTNGYYGWYTLDLDRDPVAAGFADGVTIQWDVADGPASYPSTLGGTIQAHYNTHAFAIGGNRLLVMCGHDPSYAEAGPTRATLATSHTPIGRTAYVRKNHMLTPELFFDFCRDVGAEPWINVPHASTDAMVDWLMDKAIAGTLDGRPYHVEFSNETWNSNFAQFTHFSIGKDHGNWLHSQDPVANPYTFGTPTMWMVHRALEIDARCRARLVVAGRDPDLLTMHFGSLTQGAGVTDEVIAQVVVEGKTLDHRHCLSIEGYQDNTPPGGGYSGADVNATWARCTVDGFLDLLQAATFHGSRAAWGDAHRVKLDAAGFTFCRLSGYETGWAYVAPDGDTMSVAEMMASPRMYRMTACEQSSLQDAGYAIANKYNDIYYSNIGANVAWRDFTAFGEELGTGDPAENPNAVDYPHLVCQPAGGRLAWAAGASFDGDEGEGEGGAMTGWHVPEDDAISMVAAARSSGGTTLVLADGARFGTAGWPKLVTIRRGVPSADTLITVLEFTGRAGNTLTGVGASDGHADAAIVVGDLAFLGPVKLHVTEIQDAIDALAAELEAGGGGLEIGAEVVGGTAGRVLFEGAGPVLADSISLKFDPVTQVLSSGGTSLVLRQDGDALGSSSLKLMNRAGAAGPVFGNAGLDLVDVLFETSTAAVAQFRFEHRTGQMFNPANTSEIAWSFDANLTRPPLVIGNASILVGDGCPIRFYDATEAALRLSAAIVHDWASSGYDVDRRGRLTFKVGDYSGTDRTGLVIESDGTRANVLIPGSVNIDVGDAGPIGLIVGGNSGNDRQRWKSISGTVTVVVDSNGNLVLTGGMIGFNSATISTATACSLSRSGNMFQINSGSTGLVINNSGNTANLFQLTDQGRLGVYHANPGAQVHVVTGSAATAGLIVQGAASQTAPLVALQGVTSLPTVQNQATLDASWVDSTDATRKGRVVLSACDWVVAREGLRIEADGTKAKLGLYGHVAVGQGAAIANATDATTVIARLNDLLTYLRSRGDIAP